VNALTLAPTERHLRSIGDEFVMRRNGQSGLWAKVTLTSTLIVVNERARPSLHNPSSPGERLADDAVWTWQATEPSPFGYPRLIPRHFRRFVSTITEGVGQGWGIRTCANELFVSGTPVASPLWDVWEEARLIPRMSHVNHRQHGFLALDPVWRSAAVKERLGYQVASYDSGWHSLPHYPYWLGCRLVRKLRSTMVQDLAVLSLWLLDEADREQRPGYAGERSLTDFVEWSGLDA